MMYQYLMKYALTAITNSVGAGRSAPKEVNTSLNAGITKIMITDTTTKATTQAAARRRTKKQTHTQNKTINRTTTPTTPTTARTRQANRSLRPPFLLSYPTTSSAIRNAPCPSGAPAETPPPGTP